MPQCDDGARFRLARLCGIALAFAACAGLAQAQTVDATRPRPLVLNQARYRLRAGERVPIQAPSETLTFMRSAKTRIARASGTSSRTFPVGPNVAGDQILLGVPLTTEQGDYAVEVSFVNDAGEERTATFQVTVEPFAAAAVGSTVPPVVLLDGWQLNLNSSCPMSNDSSGTFDYLQSYLLGSPNYVPNVYFFENCTECPNCSIEQLGAYLGTFLNLLGVPQVDVVAHSMGGLIVRSYLSGKQTASGSFSPPATQKIRKAVFIGTPHFGSFQADSTVSDILFAAGIQTDEMKRGSQFLWDLAKWNQFGDDLRGVDALAVIGDAGSYDSLLSLGGLSQASDGVVALSSGSLDFASPGRTRIVNYCHVSVSPGLEADYLGCVGPGIAYIDSPSHPTYEIVSSFLLSSNAWESVGNAPAQDQYLSKYGGMVVADVNASDQFVGGFSGVSWGSVQLSDGAAGGELYYSDFISGTASFTFGVSTCGPYTETAGVYSTVRCKFGPSVFSVGPLIPGSGKVVQAGTTITINGTGFGAQQCATCQVTAANPQSTALQVYSWGNTAITAFLPASYGIGIARIGVTTASGSDAINIMAQAPPPMISLSPTQLQFSYTVGGTVPASQTVVVSNSGGGTLAWFPTPNVPWLTLTVANVLGVNSLTVSVNPSGLSPNTYTGTITITAAGASNSPQSISVTLTVTAPPPGAPSISLSTNQANFTYTTGGAAPSPDPISISNSGGGTLSWSASSDSSWLSVTPSGTAPSSLMISVTPTGLTPGPYHGIITITAAGASNSPQTVSVTLTVTSAAISTSTLPHVADGNGFDTLVLLINMGTMDANYSLQFFNQSGAQVTYQLDPAQSGMTGTIHAGSQAIVRTTGSGNSTHLGWGQLTAPPSVKGMVIYQQQTSATSLQEGSAPITPPNQHFFVPFNNVGATTSIGFVNPSPTQTATVNFTVRYESGGTDVVPALKMNPLLQIAEPVTSLWANTSGKRGMIEVDANTDIGLVAFRFQGSAFTLFDTIGDTSGGTTPVTSTIAHTADGNNFRSTFLLTNSGTVAAPYTLSIFNATGQPQTFGFDVPSPLAGTISAGSTLTIDTTGLGNVTNLGWAQLSAAPAVSGLEVFRQTNPGQSEQQATIPIGQTNLSHFFLPFDNAGNTTSIALSNPDPATTATINVTFRYVDGTSNTGQLTLPPRNYKADLLANFFAATAGKAGVAEFASNVPIAVVEVRFNPTQAFTSLRAVGP